MSSKIDVLRAMVEDVSLAVEIRREAAARLAQLLPSVGDQIVQFVALLPAEVVEMLADWPEP